MHKKREDARCILLLGLFELKTIPDDPGGFFRG